MTLASMSRLFLLPLVFAGGLLVAGCEEQGPLEDLGESADEAVNDAGRAVEDATD